MISTVLKPLAAAMSIAALTYSASASALVLNTATESELFTLVLSERTFSIANTDGVLTLNNVDPATSSQQALSFNKFNPALGDLLSVSMELRSRDGSPARLDAKLEENGTVTFRALGDVDLLLTGPGFIQDVAIHRDVDLSCSITIEDESGKTCDQEVGAIANNTIIGLVEGSLASFVGAGTFDLTAKISGVLTPATTPIADANFFDNSSMSGSLSPRWIGRVDLIYTYETRDEPPGVPEPVTLALLGAGLGAAALVRRRKRQGQGSTR